MQPTQLAIRWFVILVIVATGAAMFRHEYDSRSDDPLFDAILNTNATEIRNMAARGNLDVNRLTACGVPPVSLAAIAAQRDGGDMLAALLAAGADANLPDKYGWTPLMHAVARNDHHAASMLLRAGADPNAQRPGGGNALTCAADSDCDAQMFALLVDAGARPVSFALHAKPH